MPDFDRFWGLYPKKRNKRAARFQWDLLFYGKPPEDCDDIEDQIWSALDWQVPEMAGKDERYIPMPENWLRWRRFEDEPPARKPQTLDERMWEKQRQWGWEQTAEGWRPKRTD